MSIRLRLTLAVVVLVTAATGVLGWVVVGEARSSMVDRLDERLVDAADRPVREGLGRPRPGAVASDERSVAEVVVRADGEVALSLPAGFGDSPEPLPELPDPASGDADGLVGRIVTVGSVDGSADQRLLTTRMAGGFDGYRFLAASLAPVDATTSRLWGVFALTLLAVAAAGAAAAWWLVRSGLRPVDAMIDTAGAIAGGDLTARVDHPADTTELGRLGTALDAMLGRLEAAFAEQQAGESRLKRFAADASHELRTPITTIRGYAELYRRGGLTDEGALDRAMERVEGEATRMGLLVEDLLLLARLDQQRPLDLRPVDLAAIVADAVDDHRAVSRDHPVTLELPDGGSTSISGDEAALRQVVGNLLANAREHTPPGTAVRVSLQTSDGQAVLVVADDGPGLAPEQLERAFERFHRGDPSRARSTGGTGLGLAIVEAVVGAHGGTVAVTNADPGLQVTVHLPQT